MKQCVFKLLLAVALMSPVMAIQAQEALDGKNLYMVCQGCHGAEGEGNSVLKAPAIGGQPAWYISRQISNFVEDRRGTKEDDVSGNQMRTIAQGINKDSKQLDVLVGYIEHLKPALTGKATIKGDAEQGRRLYEPCQVCHGEKGEGKRSADAPPLKNLQDWYLYDQIIKFKKAERGYHADDIQGRTMSVLMKLLPGEKQVRDVTSYINNL